MKKTYCFHSKDEKTGLWRIQALIDIPNQNVKAGDFGGLIESEKKLKA